MKNKFLIIRVILGLLIVLISVLAFLKIGDERIMMPSILLLLGVLQLFNGLDFTSKSIERKGFGIFLILSSIFLMFIAISIMIMMFK